MRYLKRLAMPLGTVVILSLAYGSLGTIPALGADKSTLSKLKVQAASESVPALKYSLLPSFVDCTSGNAAMDYNRMIVLWQNSDKNNLEERLSEWLEIPLAELPREEIREVLAQQNTILKGLTRATRRDDCDWQLPIRETANPFSIVIPELSQLRSLARLLAVKARLEIAEGRFDDATQTLQGGYTMAQHIAESPLIINGLVGMAVSDMMSKRVEELIAQPDSPNMYWPLTTLPSPVISIRNTIAAEMNMFDMLIPELRNIETSPGTPEQWRAIVERICESGAATIWIGPEGKNRTRHALIGLVAKEYPNAKRALLARGLSPETVETMPVAQVVALHIAGQFRIYCDNTFKWFELPYWQACEGLDAADKELGAARRQGISLAGMLLPALSRCKLGEAKTERNIAMLRTVEAVRMHAAANQGRLPSQLSDITVVPLPIDPMSGKPFDYLLKGDTAVIDATAPQGTSKKSYQKTIEIQLIKPNSK